MPICFKIARYNHPERIIFRC